MRALSISRDGVVRLLYMIRMFAREDVGRAKAVFSPPVLSPYVKRAYAVINNLYTYNYKNRNSRVIWGLLESFRAFRRDVLSRVAKVSLLETNTVLAERHACRPCKKKIFKSKGKTTLCCTDRLIYIISIHS